MSVLIKGMNMPQDCYDCRFMDFSGDYPYCVATETQKGYTYISRMHTERMDSCPLVELPPHGRLIDADALTDDLEFDVRNDEQIIDELKKDLPDGFIDIRIATTQDDKDIKQNCIELIKATKTIIEAEE